MQRSWYRSSVLPTCTTSAGGSDSSSRYAVYFEPPLGVDRIHGFLAVPSPLMRLRPPSLEPDDTARGACCPLLRSAPGYSCGSDLRRSSQTTRLGARAVRFCGLRLATHAAPTSVARARRHGSGRVLSASAVCAWLLMRLRPPSLEPDDTARGGVLSASAVCAWLLMRLRPPSLEPDDTARGACCPLLRSAPGYSSHRAPG